MKKDNVLELEITDYAFEGKGIARVKWGNDENAKKGFVIFVDGTYPGDVVTARIIKVRKSYAEAKLERLISSSQHRVMPKCKYFGTCGGCKQQDLNYEYQLKYKQEQVKDIFERIGGFSDLNILPIIPAKNIFYYRNKMEFSFSDERWLTEDEISQNSEIEEKNFALGLHIPGNFYKVLDIDECFLQSEISNSFLNFTRIFFKQNGIIPYSIRKQTGFLRNLVIRQSFHTDDLMLNLVTSEENENLLARFAEEIENRFPSVTTIVNNISKKKSQVALGDYEKVYLGNGFIYDFIADWKFRISANSFFQTNTLQAEILYNTAIQFADFKGDEIVYDLYSGAGTIPIFISKNVKEIFGFESVESAIKDAEVNYELNDVKNFQPILADLNKSFLPVIDKKRIPPPHVIIADPPRSGMNPKTVKDILKLLPERIVYVSCNPATQARDIKLLCEEKYVLKKLQPVDMFPHTYHIECVALLHKR